MPALRSCLIALTSILSIGYATIAQNSRPVPKLFHALPAGGRSGTTVEVAIAGSDLDGADGLWFSDPRITATPVYGKSGTFRVVIAKEVAPTQVDIRVLTPDGVSNPRIFVVGSRPESNEVEPNNVPGSANAVALNTVVNGSLGKVDVDCFVFAGQRGHRVFLSLEAERIESKLDATLRLFDDHGVELAESRDAVGVDPFVDMTLPADGHYTVKVHDVTYNGSSEHFYRLTIHNNPQLDAVFPPIAEANHSREFALIGRNIGGARLPERSTDGRTIEVKRQTLTPVFVPTAELPRRFVGSAATLRGYLLDTMTEAGISNSLILADAEGPVIEEREPNSPETPQVVSPPFSIGGDFRATGDVDAYRFWAKKGDVWRIEAVAEGLGSVADPTFTVQSVPEKGEPVDLVTADDTPDPGLSPRFNLASVDATIRWSVPADGTYQVILNDVASSSRGDPRLFYRFSIRRERPGFHLFVVPTAPNALDSVTIRRGGRSSAIVLAWRLDGFAGPIWVGSECLPPGLRCEPVVISSGQVATPIVIEADADATPGARVVKLIGLASTTRVTPPSPVNFEAWKGFDLRSEAIPGSVSWPPLKLPTSQRTPVAIVRATRGFVVAVSDNSPFLLTARPKRHVVAQGQVIELDLSVLRTTASDEPITLTAADLPAGFAPPVGNLAKGTSGMKLDWAVPKTVTPGIYSLIVRGSSTYTPDSKKPSVKVNEPSNPFLVTIRPAPIVLSIGTKPTALKPGATAEVEVSIVRQGHYLGPVLLSFDAPPSSKLKADRVTVASGQSTVKFSLRADKNSPAATVAGTLRAESLVGGETIEVALSLAVVVQKP